MKNRMMYFTTSLMLFLSIGVFAMAGYSQAQQGDQAIMEGQKAIMEGAKQMMDGTKEIMGTMSKKGMNDPGVMKADKMMSEGYEMIMKGDGMMKGATMPEGREMVKKGAKTMLEAQKEMTSAVGKTEMVKECSIYLDTCKTGEQMVKEGALMWYFGGGI